MTSDADRAIATLFADLAPKFGLSRPAGHCFAAIWRAASAPTADDLTERCGLSRSGVSVALKELRGWGLIDIARSPGSRRDHFVAPADPWDIARRITAERQRRDIAATLERLHSINATTPDLRAQALAEMFDIASLALTAATRRGAADFAQHIGQWVEDEDEPIENGRKKKRKKKS